MYRILMAVVLCLAGFAACAETTCNITTVPATFGTYDYVLPDNDSTSGGINVSCQVQSSPPGSVAYTLKMSTGNSPTYAPRQMRNGSAVMVYNLYVSGVRNVASIWGDGTSGTQIVSGVINGLNSVGAQGSNDHVVYGRIPSGQSMLLAGSYSDSIFVTLTF